MSATSGHVERGSCPAARYVDSLIVPHPDASSPRILLHETAAGWSLPSMTWTERHFWQTTLEVNRRCYSETGIRAVALRCVSIAESDDTERFVYEMDTLQLPDSAGESGCWVTLTELSNMQIVPASDREFIERWLQEQETGIVPELRPAWSRPGWFFAASKLIEHALVARQRRLAGPIEQIRTWGRSTVLRAHTSSGDVYFKAVPPMFAHEVVVTGYLAARFPDAGVATIAIDTDPYWLLMESLPGTPLEEIKDLAAWTRAFGSLAELQVKLVDATADLRDLDCPERSLAGLRAAIPGIADDDVLQLLGRDGGLTTEQSVLLRSSVNVLQDACDELIALGVPMSLEHGDLHPGNIVVDGPNDRFFDWSDCALSHPFFSLVLYFEDTAGALQQDEMTRTAIRDAYLAPWAGVASDADLSRAFDLAQLLAPVANAWMYQTQIQPGLEQQWEMDRMAPHYLRTALKRIEGTTTSSQRV